MKLLSKNFILYSLLIAAILVGGLHYFVREEPLEDKKQESIVTRMAFSGSNMSEDIDGKRVWELTARVIEVDPKTRLVYMTDLKGTLYRTDGSKIGLTAKTAVIDPKTRNIEMDDGLAMKTDDGAALKADKGRYQAQERKIYASGSVRATQDDTVLTANELETDDKFAMILAKGNARIVKGGPQQ
jgi:LPS export ABC transporter protein LptC